MCTAQAFFNCLRDNIDLYHERKCGTFYMQAHPFAIIYYLLPQPKTLISVASTATTNRSSLNPHLCQLAPPFPHCPSTLFLDPRGNLRDEIEAQIFSRNLLVTWPPDCVKQIARIQLLCTEQMGQREWMWWLYDATQIKG